MEYVQPAGRDDDAIAVALSGGGIRAALFSAGALLAVSEYASDHGKRVVTSAVSGSALFMAEVAYTKAESDAEAVLQVARRIAWRGYWPRIRAWWFALGLIEAAALVAYWFLSRPHDKVGFVIGLETVALIAAIAWAGLFRTQGISIRRAPDAPRRPRRQSIYRAKASDFTRVPGRRLTLPTTAFNLTSLSTGARFSVEGRALTADHTVLDVAQASAAFPGVFIPRRIDSLGADVFADGGISDNTGLEYITSLAPSPGLVVAVDASAPTSAPDTVPYERISRAAKPAAWTMVGWLGAVVAVGIAGRVGHWQWLTLASSALLAVGMLTVMAVGARLYYLAVKVDLRWLANGWPATLGRASDYIRARADAHFAAAGGRIIHVRLGDGPLDQIPTQLSPLPVATAQSLVRDAYERTATSLGPGPRTDTVALIDAIEEHTAIGKIRRIWHSIGPCRSSERCR